MKIKKCAFCIGGIGLSCLLLTACGATVAEPQDAVTIQPLESTLIVDAGQYTPGDPPESMELVTQKGYLAMFADATNGDFAIEDMRTLTWWYSNPPDRESDEVATGATKQWLSSQLLVSDVILSSKTVKTKSSTVACEQKGGLSVELLEDGMRVVYNFVKEGYEIPVTYTLYEDSFRAEIDTDIIKEEGAERILSIHLLPFFGAQNDEHEGYILTGNGGGGIIDFNNGKTGVSSYRVQIGGSDPVTSPVQLQNVQEKTLLPLYGMQTDGQGLLAICDVGASLAYLNASVSGLQTSYNNAYFEYEMRISQLVTIGDETSSSSRDVVTYDTSPLTGKLGVRYFFLGENEEGLAGMANVTRLYLQAMDATATNAASAAPIYLSVLGAVRQTTSVLGFRVEQNKAMTTLKQARQIVTELSEENVQGIRVLYDNWSSSQLKGQLCDEVDLWSGLGNIDELRSLQELVSQSGGQVYLKTPFVKYYSSGNGVSLNSDSIRDLNKAAAEQKIYKRNTLFPDSDAVTGRILQAGKVSQLIRRFIGNLQKKDLTVGVMPEEYADVLYRDFSRDGCSRAEMADIMTATLQSSCTQIKLVSEAPFFNAVPSFDDIVSVPSSATEYPLLDRSVPFYQMVLHGYISYSCAAINATGDAQRAYLTAIAQGAGLHYELTAQNTQLLKGVQEDSYYGSDYTSWKETIVQQYGRYARLWEKTGQATMVEYTAVEPDVILTVYDNGVYTIVNLNKTAVEIDGIQIPARDFVLGEV